MSTYMVLGRNVGEREHQMDLLLLSMRYKRPAPPLSEAFYTFYTLIYSWRLWKKGNPIALATIALRRPAPTGEAVNKTLHNEKAELGLSSRSSSFACHYKAHKPNQLVLVIQRVTKSPSRSLQIRLPQSDHPATVTYWLKVCGQE